jgi:hypothetical protein
VRKRRPSPREFKERTLGRSSHRPSLRITQSWKVRRGRPTTFWRTRSIEIAYELLFKPRQAFQCYVFAFVDFMLSDKAVGDPDSASPFLLLLVNRVERDPGSAAQIYVDEILTRRSLQSAKPEARPQRPICWTNNLPD